MQFYPGYHQPAQAHYLQRCMISISRLETRLSDFAPPSNGWLLDSRAFSILKQHGCYLSTPEQYAAQIVRWAHVGLLLAAASQDYMCEPFILKRTGLTIAEHQRLTIDRYDAIVAEVARLTSGLHVHPYVLPVLQGYLPEQYVAHLSQYGDRLAQGAWVGVGSVCKRNGSPREIATVLREIKRVRPDVRLHGFGLKKTALQSSEVLRLLDTADSMAWSSRARFARYHEGDLSRDANSWKEAAAYAHTIEQRAHAVALDAATERPIEILLRGANTQ
jgi:hypothetical protein